MTDIPAADTAPEDVVVIDTEQTRDHRVRFTLPGGRLTMQLRALRSQEARAQGLSGQDYARLVTGHDGGHLAFCVCDGVGSSYRGDFAARYLGIRLVSRLFALDGVPRRIQALERDLRAEMERWAHDAQRELLATSGPEVGSALEREVLEELRVDYGSEAVFLAGRVDVSTAMSMELGRGKASAARMLLCWMGNVQARLRSGGRIQSFDGMDDDRARWSSARGVRGRLRIATLTATAPWRLIVHTDGFAALSANIFTFSEEELRREEQRLLDLPTSDDMTLLAIEWAADGNAGASAWTAERQSRG